ncbi:hypothetical protein ABRQ46_001443 [Escherichia coli]
MPIIDLNQLPAPDVVEELDFETILAERKATLISLYSTSIYHSERNAGQF